MNRFNVATLSATLSLRLQLIFFISAVALSGKVSAQEKSQIVRIEKLQIDSTQLEKYRAALQTEIETSIRVEPGVLTLYAVEEKKRSGYITIFEVYANEAAYRSHLETPHFKKYKVATKDMVRSLELTEMNTIVLGAKPRK